MGDLGNRANVMGPQPIGAHVTPPPQMLEATAKLLNALTRGDKAAALKMCNRQAQGQLERIADSIEPGAYDETEITGRARVVKHYFIKARLSGAGKRPMTVQFRIGPEDNGEWTVREAMNLSGVRSGWTK
jgi:hypothetical protein